MPERAYEQFANALRHTFSAAKDHKELAGWIAPEVNELEKPELVQVLDSLTSLYRLRSSHGVSTQRLASDVTASVSSDSTVKIPGEAISVLEKRVAEALTMDALSVVRVKAKELQFEAERTLCEARVITDVRPVFGSNAADPPTGFIIVHSLKLGYHDANSGQHKEIYVALDETDIAKLKDALKRAEEKSKTLKSKLETTGVPVVDFQ